MVGSWSKENQGHFDPSWLKFRPLICTHIGSSVEIVTKPIALLRHRVTDLSAVLHVPEALLIQGSVAVSVLVGSRTAETVENLDWCGLTLEKRGFLNDETIHMSVNRGRMEMWAVGGGRHWSTRASMQSRRVKKLTLRIMAYLGSEFETPREWRTMTVQLTKEKNERRSLRRPHLWVTIERKFYWVQRNINSSSLSIYW